MGCRVPRQQNSADGRGGRHDSRSDIERNGAASTGERCPRKATIRDDERHARFNWGFTTLQVVIIYRT